MIRRVAGVALAALLFVLVAPGGAEARPGDRYVALGDSYTAGPLIPAQVAPLGCLKSNRNYPNLVATALGASSFRDVSCSGAETSDLHAPQDVSPDGPNPAQLDALDASTTVVTLGIGGNDIGFSEIVQECATLNPFSSPCRDKYVVNGVDEISRRIQATGPDVAAALTQIRTRAPSARIFVVGYPQILPSRGIGCWPSLPISFSDVGYLRAKTVELNAMLRNRAAGAGAGVGFVDTYGPSEGRRRVRLAPCPLGRATRPRFVSRTGPPQRPRHGRHGGSGRLCRGLSTHRSGQLELSRT